MALNNTIVERTAQLVAPDPARNQVTVNLESCTVTTPDGASYAFSIAPADREMLLEGLDAIAVTMKRDDEILAFQGRDRLRRPWIYL